MTGFCLTEGQGELPGSQHFRVENKKFFFDVGSNQRGVFLRISEVNDIKVASTEKIILKMFVMKSKQKQCFFRCR